MFLGACFDDVVSGGFSQVAPPTQSDCCFGGELKNRNWNMKRLCAQCDVGTSTFQGFDFQCLLSILFFGLVLAFVCRIRFMPHDICVTFLKFGTAFSC